MLKYNDYLSTETNFSSFYPEGGSQITNNHLYEDNFFATSDNLKDIQKGKKMSVH